MAETRDSGSFEELAMPLFARLYNFACWLTQNREAAEDLVQEAYLKAFKGFSTYQQGTDFRAWIYRILRHSFLATQAGIRATSAISFPSEGSTVEPGTDCRPETILLARVDQERLQEALEDLPLNLREVLLLSDLEEMTYREVSQTLGLPLGTVVARLSHARSTLRSLLIAPRRVRAAAIPAQPEAEKRPVERSTFAAPDFDDVPEMDEGPERHREPEFFDDVPEMEDMPESRRGPNLKNDEPETIHVQGILDDVPELEDWRESIRGPKLKNDKPKAIHEKGIFDDVPEIEDHPPLQRELKLTDDKREVIHVQGILDDVPAIDDPRIKEIEDLRIREKYGPGKKRPDDVRIREIDEEGSPLE